MSYIAEKDAEHAVKKAHKREKRRKSDEAFAQVAAASAPASVSALPSTSSANTDEEKKKLAKLERKAEKKRKRKEEKEGLAATTTQNALTSNGDDQALGSKKNKAALENEVESEKAARKAAKKAAKKAKKESQQGANGVTPQEVTGDDNPAIECKLAGATSVTNAAAARAYMQSNNITIEAPEESQDAPPLPMIAFEELEGRIDRRLKQELDSHKFTKPTPIQACCWSVLLARKDVVGIAETGSGKTMAFGLPAMQHVLELTQKATDSSVSKGKGKKGKSSSVSVLVVAPTRELAIQTQMTMEKLANALNYGSICLYGGVSKQEQIRQLQSSPLPIRAVVGTPGRLLDLAREGFLDLSNVTFAVLDEADRMLDVGFEPDIRAILGMTKTSQQGRQTSMFSATWPMSLRGLAESFMKEPMRVTIGSDELSANHRVEQSVEVLEDSYAKQGRLDAFLRQIGAGPRGRAPKDKVIIFALYKKEAQRVEDTLKRKGYQVAGIHGDLSQAQRIASLDSFKSGENPLLVATDVAARGIDVPLVEYVVNYTFPLTIEDYVHRIGRTGRAGRTGKSITFFTSEDKAHAGELIRILKDSNQPVPDAMKQFPTTIKRKEHSSYGAHFREMVPGKAKKITFDD